MRLVICQVAAISLAIFVGCKKDDGSPGPQAAQESAKKDVQVDDGEDEGAISGTTEATNEDLLLALNDPEVDRVTVYVDAETYDAVEKVLVAETPPAEEEGGVGVAALNLAAPLIKVGSGAQSVLLDVLEQEANRVKLVGMNMPEFKVLRNEQADFAKAFAKSSLASGFDFVPVPNAPLGTFMFKPKPLVSNAIQTQLGTGAAQAIDISRLSSNLRGGGIKVGAGFKPLTLKGLSVADADIINGRLAMEAPGFVIANKGNGVYELALEKPKVAQLPVNVKGAPRPAVLQKVPAGKPVPKPVVHAYAPGRALKKDPGVIYRADISGKAVLNPNHVVAVGAGGKGLAIDLKHVPEFHSLAKSGSISDTHMTIGYFPNGMPGSVVGIAQDEFRKWQAAHTGAVDFQGLRKAGDRSVAVGGDLDGLRAAIAARVQQHCLNASPAIKYSPPYGTGSHVAVIAQKLTPN